MTEKIEMTDMQLLREGMRSLDHALMHLMEMHSILGKQLANKVYAAFIQSEKLERKLMAEEVRSKTPGE